MDDKIENLRISEINKRWSASWDKNGEHFDVDQLYGYDHPRSFCQLKDILDNDHCVLLPSELAVKAYAIQKGHKNIYEVDEKLINYRIDSSEHPKIVYPSKMAACERE